MSLELLLSRFLYYVEKGYPLPVAFKKAKQMKGYKVDGATAYDKARLLVLQYYSLRGKSRRKKVGQFLSGNGEVKLPDWMEKKLSELYDLRKLKESLKMRTTWFWVNTLKGDQDKVIRRIEDKDILIERDSQIPYLYKVLKGDLTKLEEFRDYKIIIQDKASVSVVNTLDPKKGETIFDMTSAPGIKSILVMALTDNGVNLTVTELDYKRLRKEIALMKSAGVNLNKVNIIHADARYISFSKKFDKVLLDAPCSSSGMIANEPTVLLRLTEKRVQELSKLQEVLLENALTLSDNVVYATCSLFPEEGENVIKSVNAKTVYYKRFIPYVDYTEGFFISRLEG
ncbi:RsmB/NOP family class I SAM-dependent RNA methyltransferase [Stygiolobus caldivivus]|uniref:rRNA cytosine-C5-methyltransferase n=1 Tax=Stygiolobus caldivivus TaxID=2824673 RepID=A0A8D5U6U4_9CREN|nr:RsmB/NOP family class I SAM-dependent RNA methyltransferase [Stygiolobus caldivivus]BCU70302.1 rRNA cytosine-C5-methyltransferase [Stygiolobus caldivivus]